MQFIFAGCYGLFAGCYGLFTIYSKLIIFPLRVTIFWFIFSVYYLFNFMRLVIITGTFGYPALIEKLLGNALALSRRYTEVLIQYGQFTPSNLPYALDGIKITAVSYYSKLDEFIAGASLVVTHAGTGTLLELLQGSTPFIVVPNKELSGDHQSDLAHVLRKTSVRVCGLDEILNEVCSLDLVKVTPSKTNANSGLPPNPKLIVSGDIWNKLLKHN